jgi:hypothetical protein
MNPECDHILTAAEKAVARLLDMCRKNAPLYRQNPRAVAQVNRTSRWLLNALSRLKHELNTASGRPAA